MLTDYRLRDTHTIRSPIVCAVGSLDRPSNSEQNVKAWLAQSSSPRSSFRLFEGGTHFFYSEPPTMAPFMQWLWKEVSELLLH